MNVRFRILFLSAITMSLMGESQSNGFFNAYAESVKQGFKPAGVHFFENGNGNAVRASNELVVTNRTMIASQLEVFNKNGTREYLKHTGSVRGGGMTSKFFEIKEHTVNTESNTFKEKSEEKAGENLGQSVDINKPNAAAEGRRRGIAGGILLGPVNWLGLGIMCNTNAPQVGVGIMILANALGLYNLNAETTYPSEVSKREYKNKKDFWATLIIASTIATRVMTVSHDVY